MRTTHPPRPQKCVDRRPSWPLSRSPESARFTWACAGCDRCADQRGAPPAGPPPADLARRAGNELRAPAARLRLRAPAVAAAERPPPLREAGREAAADPGHEPAAGSVAGLRRRHELAPGADRGCEPRRPLLLRGQRRRPALHGELRESPAVSPPVSAWNDGQSQERAAAPRLPRPRGSQVPGPLGGPRPAAGRTWP